VGGGPVSRLFADPVPVRLTWCEGELEALRIGTMRLPVAEIVRRWRVDAEWWADGPARDYLTLRTVGGQIVEVYGDRRSGQWFLQRLAD
jgi:hypothetical protein